MIYSISFELAGLPKMPNDLLGAHWRTRSGNAAKWRKYVWAAVGSNKPREPLKKAVVTLVRHSSVEPDTDGGRGSFKVILDALVSVGVLANDKPENIGEPAYHWVKAKPKGGKVSVIVTEIREGETE